MIKKENKIDIYTKIGIICLIISISGIFGFLYEFIFYYLNSGMTQFYYRGGNFLPWINIYAYGALLIILLTKNQTKHPLKIFLISALTCGILELISGWILYGILNQTRCWDYNQEILNFGNIGGFVCLRSVLFFGLSGLILIYLIYPLCIKISKKMNKKAFIIISITLCSIFLLDEIYNLIIARILSLPRASDIYKQLGIHYIYFNK